MLPSRSCTVDRLTISGSARHFRHVRLNIVVEPLPSADRRARIRPGGAGPGSSGRSSEGAARCSAAGCRRRPGHADLHAVRERRVSVLDLSGSRLPARRSRVAAPQLLPVGGHADAKEARRADTSATAATAARRRAMPFAFRLRRPPLRGAPAPARGLLRRVAGWHLREPRVHANLDPSCRRRRPRDPSASASRLIAS